MRLNATFFKEKHKELCLTRQKRQQISKKSTNH